MATITSDQVMLYVQIGEALVPIVKATIDDITAFVASRNGNLDVLAQLTSNAQTIDETEKIVDAEIAADTPPNPPTS